jgi:cytochrome c oxidase assembly factor CtaG
MSSFVASQSGFGRAPLRLLTMLPVLGHTTVALACAEHELGHNEASLLSALWSWDPLGLCLLACSAAVYATGLVRLYRHAGFGHGVRPIEVAAFTTGWLGLAVALLSPLDTLSDVLFSAHMTQHELLMLIAAPGMVMGKPWITFAWALPERARLTVLQRLRNAQQVPFCRTLTAPLTVLVLHALALWLWHVPALFHAALRDERVHALQHACFFFTAALFFLAVIHGRYGRVGYGISTLFVFLTAAHSGLLGALLTLASQLWYPLQSASTLPYGLCPLEDQQLAGLIMWVPAGTLLAVVALALFAAWIGESERRAQRTRLLARGPRP